MQIDINADMGESFGMYVLGSDADFMKMITSANVACGFHAGDPSVMRQTVALAKENGVQVGAHPGLPDLQGFGRREMKLSPDEVYDYVMYQAGALKAFVEAAGMRLHHVKPHGSLYGMAHRMEDVAEAICRATRDLDPELYIYLMRVGVAAGIARDMGLRVVYELYSDLDYDDEGNLVITRHHEVLEPQAVAKRVVGMVKDGKVKSTSGREIVISGNSVSVHADTPGALKNLEAVRAELEKAGYQPDSPAL